MINKDRLVCRGYDQIKGLDYDETFSPVVILESIKTILAFSCLKILKFIKWVSNLLSSMD